MRSSYIKYIEVLLNDDSDHFPIEIRLKVQKKLEKKKNKRKGKQKPLEWAAEEPGKYRVGLLEEMGMKDREGTKKGELDNWQNIKETG